MNRLDKQTKLAEQRYRTVVELGKIINERDAEVKQLKIELHKSSQKVHELEKHCKAVEKVAPSTNQRLNDLESRIESLEFKL